MLDYNPKWVKTVSPPPPGTSLARANSKKILQALDPGFMQLQEAEASPPTKTGHTRNGCSRKEQDTGPQLAQRQSTNAQKITTKGIRKYSDTFYRCLKILRWEWKIKDYKCLKILTWKNEIKRLYPYIFNLKKIVILCFFLLCMKLFFWLCTWVQETQPLKKTTY